jgi:hypothetical protein
MGCSDSIRRNVENSVGTQLSVFPQRGETDLQVDTTSLAHLEAPSFNGKQPG